MAFYGCTTVKLCSSKFSMLLLYACFLIINPCLSLCENLGRKTADVMKILQTLFYHDPFRRVTRLPFAKSFPVYTFSSKMRFDKLARYTLIEALIDHAKSNPRESRRRFSHEPQDVCARVCMR